jgi:hypothetical protein
MSTAVLATTAEGEADMTTKRTFTLLALLALLLVCPLRLVAQTPLPTLRAIFYHNVAHILLEPRLPVDIDGATPVPAHPWFEARIFGPAGPPLSLNPTIQITTALLPTRFLRPPGRIIPSPFDTGTVQFGPTPDAAAVYTAQYPQLFTPRDARNTVDLTLVDRQQSLLVQTDQLLAECHLETGQDLEHRDEVVAQRGSIRSHGRRESAPEYSIRGIEEHHFVRIVLSQRLGPFHGRGGNVLLRPGRGDGYRHE